MRIEISTLMKSQKVITRNENQGCLDGQEPCHLCGKATIPLHRIHIVEYGSHVTDEVEAEVNDDSLGWFAVCPTCFQRVKKAFGGSYPEYFMTENTGFNSIVLAVGSKQVEKFKKMVDSLLADVPEKEHEMFLNSLADYVSTMKKGGR